jgi:hypothetical protein
MTGAESIPYLLICILPFVLLGGWLLNTTMFKSLKGFISAQRWQSVSGRIVESKAVGQREMNGGTVYVPFIKYEYQVGGQNYENKKVRSGDAGGYVGIKHEETVQNNVTKEYPVGKEVQVYYNPANPAESALKRNNPALLFVGLPMTIVFDIGLLFYFRWLVSQALELL